MARLIAGLAALLTALCFASGALAHASLVSTEPADGGVVAQAPKAAFPTDLIPHPETPNGG